VARGLLRSRSNRLKSVDCIFHIGINQRHTNRHYFLGGACNEIATNNMVEYAERQI